MGKITIWTRIKWFFEQLFCFRHEWEKTDFVHVEDENKVLHQCKKCEKHKWFIRRDMGDREKYWQVAAGKMASIANWALIELLKNVDVNSNENTQANDYLDEVVPLLDFDDESQE